ncbi:hypothetical protein PG985_012815 [Apiospora marii]|uniref:uncharacterized protein n=1 Tax=Apiospora marii TaxID=335849 RepID=UPI00312EA987
MSSTGSRTCIICEKPDAKRCGRCNGTYYCSQECQHQDWPVHKLLCASFGAFDISTRPTSEHFRAISFPQGGRKPKLVWIHCNWNKPDHTIFHFPVSDSVIGPGTHPEITPVQYNPVLNRRLDDTIRIAWRDKYLSDGSKPNKSLLSVTATRPGYSHDWRGPITAYGTVGTGTDQTRYRDLGMNDFRHLTDYFLSACKLGDWPIHGLLCESYAAFNASEPRPDRRCFRTIKSLIDGSATNKSIAAITATRPGYHSDWRGCVTAYGRVDSGPEGPYCRDLDMNDFPYIADYFLASAPTPLSEQQSGTRCKHVTSCLAGIAVVAAALIAFIYQ